MASIGYLVAANRLHKGSVQKAFAPADPDAAQATHRYTGLEGIDLFLPGFRSSAFGTLGWNPRHNLTFVP